MISIQDAAEVLKNAAEILVITGAGISAESGIPTFRGEGGYWRSHAPEDLATWRAFAKDPKTVWTWYDYRRSLIAGSSPNAAHQALAGLERGGKHVFIITQNVDDLHERAGSSDVAHIHGSIWEVTCLKEHRTYAHREVPLTEIPPFCLCGGLLRPNVVWFDEELPAEVMSRVETYLNRVTPDAILVIGTEATFDYIREFIQRGKDRGALVVEINPSATAVTPMADCAIRQPATEALRILAGGEGRGMA